MKNYQFHAKLTGTITCKVKALTEITKIMPLSVAYLVNSVYFCIGSTTVLSHAEVGDILVICRCMCAD